MMHNFKCACPVAYGDIYTVDREMFAVKKFSPLAQVAKILRAKISRAQTARAICARLIFAASVGGEN